MPHWSKKTLRYQVGVLIEIAGFCVYTIGFGSPAWTQVYSLFEPGSIVSYYGLWQRCGTSVTSCYLHEKYGEVVEPWQQASRALCTVGLICSLISLALLIRFNFTQYAKQVTEEVKSIRVLPTFSGILGILGASTYAIRTQIMVSPNNAALSWAFALTVTGSCMLVISACLMTSRPGGPRQDPANRMQTWSTGVGMADASAGFGYWPGSPGGPVINPAFQDTSFPKPPEFIDAPPSYEEVMRGTV